ncbi:hypothetical protein ACRQU7_08715 [Caproiciproducens sp. R1]|uniref:hypothetical protein n=1 Tax=Caproiciproducens sp. R1 TaxID=3435000 RepID=UPI004034B04E
MAAYDLNTYEILVVDLRLSEHSCGYDIIRAIREGNYVNDVLFYSAEGVQVLSAIMKEYGLEGVFITDRNHKIFVPKIKQLIDKSIRRSENVINIRGIVMDETSEFDTQMCEIVNAVQPHMTKEEVLSLKEYIANHLLKNKSDDTIAFATKYQNDGDWSISDVISENDFTSMMKAKLINHILNIKSNSFISTAVNSCHDDFPEIFDNEKIKFVSKYDDDILKFRNKLAHVKQLNAESPVYIGKVNGIDYRCNEEFCSLLRSSLIKYGDWFKAIFFNVSQA